MHTQTKQWALIGRECLVLLQYVVGPLLVVYCTVASPAAVAEGLNKTTASHRLAASTTATVYNIMTVTRRKASLQKVQIETTPLDFE